MSLMSPGSPPSLSPSLPQSRSGLKAFISHNHVQHKPSVLYSMAPQFPEDGALLPHRQGHQSQCDRVPEFRSAGECVCTKQDIVWLAPHSFLLHDNSHSVACWAA